MNLHYTISGTGEPLVFLHGAYINSEIWQYQNAYFKKNYQVITLDMRGHGKSDSSELDEYSVATFGEDLIELLDKLGIERFTICGLSLGAMVAQYVAAQYPQRVRSLVLVGTAASLRLSLLERVVTTFIFPKWVAMWLFGNLSTRQFMKISFFLTWFMRGNKWLGGPNTRAAIRESISRVEKKELKKIYAAFHTFRKQDLQRGDFPVLLINGQYDSPIIHQHARFIHKKVGNRGAFMVVPNCGHACNYDQPLVFNRMLQQWLSQQDILPASEMPIEKGYTSEYTKSPALHHAS